MTAKLLPEADGDDSVNGDEGAGIDDDATTEADQVATGLEAETNEVESTENQNPTTGTSNIPRLEPNEQNTNFTFPVCSFQRS